MVGEEGEEEEYQRGRKRPGCRESGSRSFLMGMNPGSRGGSASHGLMNEGGWRIG